MKFFQMQPMQLLKGICQRRVIRIGLVVLLLSLLSIVNKTEVEIYNILNSLIYVYTKSINNEVYLSKTILERDNPILRDIFNDSGFIYDEICDKKLEVTKKDFIASMEKKTFSKWDYSKIKNKKLITEIILDEDAKKKYDASNIKNMLKNEHEIDAYKYILWNNPNNIPLIRLSHPFISKDKKYAILYMSKYSDGTFVWILENETMKSWKVICEKRLSHY